MGRKQISDITRHNVFRAYCEGVSRKDISEEFAISLSSVGRIIAFMKKNTEKTCPSGPVQSRKARIDAFEKKLLDLERKINRLA